MPALFHGLLGLMLALGLTSPSTANEVWPAAAFKDPALGATVQALHEHWGELRKTRRAYSVLLFDFTPEGNRSDAGKSLPIAQGYQAMANLDSTVISPGRVLLDSASMLLLVPEAIRPDAMPAIASQCHTLLLGTLGNTQRQASWQPVVHASPDDAAFKGFPDDLLERIRTLYQSASRFSQALAEFCELAEDASGKELPAGGDKEKE